MAGYATVESVPRSTGATALRATIDAPELSSADARPRRLVLTSNPAAAKPSALDTDGLAEVRRVGNADLMVGIPSFGNAETIGYVVRATTAGMVQYFPELKPI